MKCQYDPHFLDLDVEKETYCGKSATLAVIGHADWYDAKIPNMIFVCKDCVDEAEHVFPGKRASIFQSEFYMDPWQRFQLAVYEAESADFEGRAEAEWLSKGECFPCECSCFVCNPVPWSPLTAETGYGHPSYYENVRKSLIDLINFDRPCESILCSEDISLTDYGPAPFDDEDLPF